MAGRGIGPSCCLDTTPNLIGPVSHYELLSQRMPRSRLKSELAASSVKPEIRYRKPNIMV